MTKPFVVRDHYFHKAKRSNLRARSAFKLDEIQKKFNLIGSGHTIADLGAAPGSWSQRLSQWVGIEGRVIAFDLQSIDFIANNVMICAGDIIDLDFLNKIFDQIGLSKHSLNGVTADLAPKTTGVSDADAYHSVELNHAALNFCNHWLKPNGYLISKIFEGAEFSEVLMRAKKIFKQVNCFKPQACRDRSRETYIVGRGFRG